MDDHRVHMRVGCQFEFSCRSYLNAAGEQIYFESPIEFEAINLSVGGVLARSQADLAEDIVLQFTLYLECVPYIIMSRIRWKDYSTKGFLYGMEFLIISNMLHRHLKEYTERYSDKSYE